MSLGVLFAGMAVSTVSFPFPFSCFLTSLFSLSSWIHLPADFYHFCSSLSSVMTTKCRQPAQLCVLQSWLPEDPSVPLRQALDAGLHLCVQASLPYQCPPASCCLPPAMPLSPPASWRLLLPAGPVCPGSTVLYSWAVGLTSGTEWAQLMALQLCNLSQQCWKCHS